MRTFVVVQDRGKKVIKNFAAWKGQEKKLAIDGFSTSCTKIYQPQLLSIRLIIRLFMWTRGRFYLLDDRIGAWIRLKEQTYHLNISLKVLFPCQREKCDIHKRHSKPLSILNIRLIWASILSSMHIFQLFESICHFMHKTGRCSVKNRATLTCHPKSASLKSGSEMGKGCNDFLTINPLVFWDTLQNGAENTWKILRSIKCKLV